MNLFLLSISPYSGHSLGDKMKENKKWKTKSEHKQKFIYLWVVTKVIAWVQLMTCQDLFPQNCLTLIGSIFLQYEKEIIMIILPGYWQNSATFRQTGEDLRNGKRENKKFYKKLNSRQWVELGHLALSRGKLNWSKMETKMSLLPTIKSQYIFLKLLQQLSKMDKIGLILHSVITLLYLPSEASWYIRMSLLI